MHGHHVVPRSQGGHEGPLVYICESCHAKHHSERHFDFTYAHGEWLADGKPFRIYDETVDIETFSDPAADNLTAALVVAWSEGDEYIGTIAWRQGESAYNLRAHLIRTLGKKDGAREFAERCADLGISKSARSRRMTVYEHLRSEPAAIQLPEYKQYEAALAVKRGKLSASEAVASIELQSVADFKSATYGTTPPEEKVPCPIDGKPCARATKEEEKHE